MGILIVSGFSVLGLIKDRMPVFRVNRFMHEAIQLQLPSTIQGVLRRVISKSNEREAESKPRAKLLPELFPK